MTQFKSLARHSCDVAIVGGGLAGLVAAWSLRDLRCLVLEAEARPGGRISSENVSGTVLNLGAHMVPSAHSATGRIISDLGLTTRSIQQPLLALLHRGRLYHGHAPETLPFVMKLGFGARIGFVRMGLKLRFGARRITGSTDIAQDGKAPSGFGEDRTLADYIGDLPDEVAEIFAALTERNGADPREMSAAHGLRSFANVWAKTAPSRNLVGGTGVLPAALTDALGPSVRVGHRVRAVRTSEQGVEVAFDGPRGDGSLSARACILATPAPLSRSLAPDLHEETREALSLIRYGSFLSLGIALEGEVTAPWRRAYAVATPGLGFSVLFNHDAMQPEGKQKGGAALMLFRGASGAREEMALDDATLRARWCADLERHFPETRGRIASIRIGRWPLGAPFGFPGRARLKDALDVRDPPLALAGDYLDFPNMEAAAESGLRAADRVREWLGMGRTG